MIDLLRYAESKANRPKLSYTVFMISGSPFCEACSSEIKYGWCDVPEYFKSNVNLIILADSIQTSCFKSYRLPIVQIPDKFKYLLKPYRGQIITLNESGVIIATHKVASASGFDHDYRMLDSLLASKSHVVRLTDFIPERTFIIPLPHSNSTTDFTSCSARLSLGDSSIQIYNSITKYLEIFSFGNRRIEIDSVPHFKEIRYLEFDKTVWVDSLGVLHVYFIGFGKPVDTVVYGKVAKMFTETYSFIGTRPFGINTTLNRTAFGTYLGNDVQTNEAGTLAWVLAGKQAADGGPSMQLLREGKNITSYSIPSKWHLFLNNSFAASDTVCILSDSGFLYRITPSTTAFKIPLSSWDSAGIQTGTSLSNTSILTQTRTKDGAESLVIYGTNGLRQSPRIECGTSKNLLGNHGKSLYSVSPAIDGSHSLNVSIYRVSDFDKPSVVVARPLIKKKYASHNK